MSKQTIIHQVDLVLKPAGFVRRKARWNRRVGDFVDAVDLQVSKSGDATTVNAGVLDPIVHTMLWGTPPPAFVEEAFCTVRSRIGELIGETDKWWRIDGEDSAAEIAREVAERVLPFVERLHSQEAMEQWLTSHGVARRRDWTQELGLTILQGLLGRTEVACATLARRAEQAESSAWRTRYAEIAVRLGCQVD